MSLEAYVAHRDKFEFDEPASDAFLVLTFPCCVCTYRHGSDMAEPCRTCDHNTNAVAEEIFPDLCSELTDGLKKPKRPFIRPAIEDDFDARIELHILTARMRQNVRIEILGERALLAIRIMAFKAYRDIYHPA